MFLKHQSHVAFRLAEFFRHGARNTPRVFVLLEPDLGCCYPGVVLFSPGFSASKAGGLSLLGYFPLG